MMPSSSAKQHKFMEAVAHNPAFAKKAGVPQSVGKDFSNADKGKTFKKGGDTMASKMDPKMMAMMMAKKKSGMGAAPARGMAPPPAPGGMGMGMMKKGGTAKKMASGGMTGSALDVGNSTKMGKVRTEQGNKDGVAIRGKTKGKQVVMSGNRMMK
jgi:hypothetical protein